MRYGPFYPNRIDPDGWTNPDNAKTFGDGEATTADYPDLNATDFGANVPLNRTIVRARLELKASAASSGRTSPSLDRIQLAKNGFPIGEVAGHMSGVPGPGWAGFDITDLNLSADDVNASDFGLVVGFWDSLDEPTGSHTISVDAVRLSLFDEQI